MADPNLSEFTRQRIRALAEDALRRAEVIDVLPTPIEAVQKVAGVSARPDIAELSALGGRRPPGLSRLLGALLFRERVVFVDRTQKAARVLFTDAHETLHVLCPWHEQSLLLDTEATLFREIREGIEREANYGAGHLIFQGDRFHRRALAEQVSLRTPLALADAYGASGHATTHFYVEEHPDALALLVTGLLRRADGTLPIWRSVESAEFRRRFGSLPCLLPGGRLSLHEDDRGPIAEIVEQSRLAVDPPSTTIRLPDRDGSEHRFVAEAYCNQHVHMVLVMERSARRLGRRLRLAS